MGCEHRQTQACLRPIENNVQKWKQWSWMLGLCTCLFEFVLKLSLRLSERCLSSFKISKLFPIGGHRQDSEWTASLWISFTHTALETFWGTVQSKVPAAHPLPAPSSSYSTRNCLPFLNYSSHLFPGSLFSHLPFLQSNATPFQDGTNMPPCCPFPIPHALSLFHLLAC